MKIAILFFGLPRQSSICLPSIEKNILAPAERLGNVEKFAHLYKQDRVFNPRSGENAELDPENYSWFEENCRNFSFSNELGSAEEREMLAGFGDAFQDGGYSLGNLYKQLHSLNRVTEDFESSDCEVAIFARPDLFYHDALTARAIRFAAARPDACVIPDWQWWAGCNDRLAICGREAAIVYGRRIREARSYCLVNGGQPLHSESLLEYVIDIHQLTLRVMHTRASRVRVGGEIKDEEFSVFKTLLGGRRKKLSMLALKAKSSRF